MTQKTFDSQTATFISKLITSFPGDLTGEEMQRCIDDPKGLRDAVHAWACSARFGTTKASRITITVIGSGLTAQEWRMRAENRGYQLASYVHGILSNPDYDAKHRLEPGKEYKVVLIQGKEIKRDSDRTIANLKSLVVRDYGEQSMGNLKAELAFLIRQRLTNDAMKSFNLGRITVLHEPIADSAGWPGVLCVSRYEGSFVSGEYGNSDRDWSDACAFAFPIS
jgi:hypothetical protein